MAEPTRTGLAYGVIRAPLPVRRAGDTAPPTAWKNISGALEGIRPAHKDLGIPEGTMFEAAHIRAGVVQVRIDAGKYGPAIAEEITALEGQGGNFLIRVSLPGVSNNAAAVALDRALNLLYGSKANVRREADECLDPSTVTSLLLGYRGKFGDADVLGIFHLDGANAPVCNLAIGQ